MEKITLKDIALKFGVTEMTVSSALRNKGRISEDMRIQIIEMANKMGYRPNAAARSIRSGRFGCLALLVSHENLTPITTDLLASLETAMSARNLHLILSRVHDEKLTDETYMPEILRESMADGLLIKHDVNIPDVMIELVERYRLSIPSVWLNSKHKNNCVYFDEFAAGLEATEHLVRLGHRKISYFTYTQRPNLHYSGNDRFEGYCEAMRRAGLKPDWLSGRPGRHFEREDRLEAIHYLLRTPNRPTAVIADNTTTARITLLAATRLALTLGHDLSIITFNDSSFDDCGIAIDVMVAPVAEMGTNSVQMLLSIIDDRKEILPPAVLKYTLQKGVTCGPLPEIHRVVGK